MKYVVGILLTVFGLAVVLPGVLYIAGISLVDGRPRPSVTLVTVEQQQEIWRHIEKTDVSPVVVGLNPWEVAASVLAGKELNGGRSVNLVAQNYNRTHIKKQRIAYWHLASAAVAIWVSRHWSEEEVLSKLYELYSYELPYNQSPKPTLESEEALRGSLGGSAAWLNR